MPKFMITQLTEHVMSKAPMDLGELVRKIHEVKVVGGDPFIALEIDVPDSSVKMVGDFLAGKCDIEPLQELYFLSE